MNGIVERKTMEKKSEKLAKNIVDIKKLKITSKFTIRANLYRLFTIFGREIGAKITLNMNVVKGTIANSLYTIIKCVLGPPDQKKKREHRETFVLKQNVAGTTNNNKKC